MPDFNITSFANLSYLHFDSAFFGGTQIKHADRVKFSNSHHITGRIKVDAPESEENAADINNKCSDFNLELELSGGRQCGLVVKGNSTDINLTILSIKRAPNACYFKFLWFTFIIDISWDDYADQSCKASSGTIINKSPDRIVLAFGRWRRPKLVGNIKTAWFLSFLMCSYNLCKDLTR
jgi:hypothetical protein